MRSLLLAGLLLSGAAAAQAPAPAAATPDPAAAPPQVLLTTNKGDIVLELNPAKAPKTVASFLQHVKSGGYNGTIFHRVINNFMIQGGGYGADNSEKPFGNPIPNEANNGLSNLRGTVAMARSSEPHSARSQFFINVADNKALDHRSQESGLTWGYAVFGKVIKGMDVVDKIKAIPTKADGCPGGVVPPTEQGQAACRFPKLPVELVLIQKAEVLAVPVTP